MAWLPALTLLFAPAYALKFGLLGLPTNLLMVWAFLMWAIFAVYIVTKKQFWEFVRFKEVLPKWLWLSAEVFLLAGTISLFVHGASQAKLGQYIVLFLQPVSLLLIFGYIFSKYPKAKNLFIVSCYLLLSVMGIYAVIQYLTLHGLPQIYWGNSVEPKRAVAFFSHPNFYALFAAPLLAFLTPDAFKNLQSKILNPKSLAWLIGAIGLGLSLSRAGWLGLAAAIGVYLLVAADNKIRKMAFGVFVVAVMVIVSVPNLRYRFLLPFYGEKSAVSRLSLWHTGWKGVKESPVLGMGLNGFSNNWMRLNTDPGLDTHNFPHNIFLDVWVETGLLGLISFLTVCGYALYKGYKNKTDVIKFGVALFVLALLVQGQIDNPYFKNDLALVFWIILALGTYEHTHQKTS